MTDWQKQKVVDLRSELRRRNLPQAGLKQDLVARLVEADAGTDNEVHSAGAPDAAEPATVEEGETTGTLITESLASASADTEAPPSQAPELQSVTPVPAAASESKDGSGPLAEPEPEPQSILDTEAELTPQKQQASSQDIQDAPAANDITPIVAESAPISGISTENGFLGASDVSMDTQKRKRRSGSPPPSPQVAKRSRPDGDTDNFEASGHEDETSLGANIVNPSLLPIREQHESANHTQTGEVRLGEVSDTSLLTTPADIAPPATETTRFIGSEAVPDPLDERRNAMDFERDVEPAVHPATAALYIRNFMRPLRAPDVQAHLIKLATPAGINSPAEEILDFYLDHIRTHAFVRFNSVAAASRVRTALHNCVWPDERNRKALWVDFIPPQKVKEWADMEESQGMGKSSSANRWVVVYEEGSDGNIVAKMDTGETAPVAPTHTAPDDVSHGPKTGVSPVGNTANNIPLGPRAQRGFEPTSRQPRFDPRPTAQRMGPVAEASGVVHSTRAKPTISYQFVSAEVARHRLDNIRELVSRDDQREPGTEKNRYSFEDGTRFVDRGPEIFEGIRPPHLERQLEQGRGRGPGWGGGGPRRGGYGGAPYRPRSDRYLPNFAGGSNREEDRTYRHDNDNRYRDGGRSRPDDRGRRDGYRDHRSRPY